jgi:hypothetical protein
MRLEDAGNDEETFAIVSGSDLWAQYVFSSRLSGRSNVSGAFFSAMFYYTDAANHYRVHVDTFDQTLKVQSVVATVVTDLVTVDLGAIGFNILADVNYTIRVTVTDELPNHRIQVTIDGAEIANLVTTKDLTLGTVGFRHDTGAIMSVDEVEVFQLPVDSDTLEINEFP